MRWKNNNYCIFTGNGFPSLLDHHLKNSIGDVNSSKKFNYLVICLDCDEDTVADRRQQVLDFINANNLHLENETKLVIIVQNKCFETWFLGNSKIFKSNPSSPLLKECINHYHVKNEDPELMEKPDNFEQSTSIYHSIYLQEILTERNVRYSKSNPQHVTEQPFLNELIKRNKKTNHLQSFKGFIDFCQEIKKEIKENDDKEQKPNFSK